MVVGCTIFCLKSTNKNERFQSTKLNPFHKLKRIIFFLYLKRKLSTCLENDIAMMHKNKSDYLLFLPVEYKWFESFFFFYWTEQMYINRHD